MNFTPDELSSEDELFLEDESYNYDITFPDNMVLLDDESYDSFRINPIAIPIDQELHLKFISDYSKYKEAPSLSELQTLALECKSNINGALRYAAERGWKDYVEWLLAGGIPIIEYSAKDNDLDSTPLPCAEKIQRDRKSYLGSALYAAVKKNHIEVLKSLLKEGALIINSCCEEAVRNGDLAMLEQLINHGMSARNKGRALQSAARMGQEDMVRLLLANGAEIDFKEYSLSPLCEAADNGHVTVVRLLLDKGANRDIVLEKIIRLERLDVVNLLFEYGEDKDEALWLAVQCGCLNMVQALIEKGADVNVYNGAALRAAKKHNHFAIIKLLLDKRAVELTLDEAINKAIEDGQDQVVGWLLMHLNDDTAKVHYYIARYGLVEQAEVWLKKTIPAEVIETAVRHNQIDLVRWLLNKINNSWAWDSERIIIKCAVKYGQTKLVEMMLQKNTTTFYALTMKYDQVNIVKVLLTHGLDKDKALVEAIKNGRLEITKLLLDQGAQMPANDWAEIRKYSFECRRLLYAYDYCNPREYPTAKLQFNGFSSETKLAFKQYRNTAKDIIYNEQALLQGIVCLVLLEGMCAQKLPYLSIEILSQVVLFLSYDELTTIAGQRLAVIGQVNQRLQDIKSTWFAQSEGLLAFRRLLLNCPLKSQASLAVAIQNKYSHTRMGFFDRQGLATNKTAELMEDIKENKVRVKAASLKF